MRSRCNTAPGCDQPPHNKEVPNLVKNSDNLIDKFLQSSYSNSEVEQILLEEKFTVFANARVFRNFTLRLRMDNEV